MTSDEALQLKSGDKIVIVGTSRVVAVSHITDEAMGHIHIWLQENGRFLLPGQAEIVGQAAPEQ